MLRILHQDDDFVAVSKPGGMAVHRGPRSTDEERFALQETRKLTGQHLFPVHRLDKATSGILTFGLSKDAAARLQRSLADAEKDYLVLARGSAPDRFESRQELTNDAGDYQPAHSEFATLARFFRCSLLRARIHTGRTHQIRRHLDHLAHQVLGDSTHGKGRINRMFRRRHGMPRMCLHAWRLAFAHPTTGESIELIDPLPHDLATFLIGLPGAPRDFLAALARERTTDLESLRPADRPTMTYVTHLESTADGSTIEAGTLQQVHGGKPILVRYDLDKAKGELTREEVMARPADMWRWSDLLPLRDHQNRVSLGETETPLLDCPRLATEMGVRSLKIKDESRLPGGSFKSRGMAMAISMAHELGVGRVAVPTAGNAGGAMAAYAARCGMDAVVVMPEDTPVVNRLEAELHGAHVEVLDALIDQCGVRVREHWVPQGWFDVSTLREPYRIEGKKTMGLELAAQCGFQLPDAIFYPTGGGTGLIGMWKAFAELDHLGWLEDPKKPAMFACQSTGCDPIVQGYDQGLDHGVVLEAPHTEASGIRVPKALGDFLILRAVRESGGRAMATAEPELYHWLRLAMRTEGIPLCPETAACLGSLRDALRDGHLSPDSEVVVFNTGAAQKYVEFLQAANNAKD